MRARLLALAAGAVGSAAVLLIARHLIRRAHDRRDQNHFEEADREFLVEEYVDAEVLGDIDATVALGERPGLDPDVAAGGGDDYATATDTGELYGVHTVQAVDTEHPDDDRAQAHGENWIEALQESAIENGPEPEAILVFLDEADLESPPTDTRDRPIADRGSGGRRGL